MTTIANHVSGTNSTLGSWLKVKETISLKFKWNKIKAEFGFYSELSVCMPRFYASTGESSWEYSTLIVTLNFILFISMVVTYVLVYKKASGMIISTFTKKDTKKGMQKRISRLFLTDFLCWIPVCVMAYLSVAGVSLPPGAYIASDGFLLPINSAMTHCFTPSSWVSTSHLHENALLTTCFPFAQVILMTSQWLKRGQSRSSSK